MSLSVRSAAVSSGQVCRTAKLATEQFGGLAADEGSPVPLQQQYDFYDAASACRRRFFLAFSPTRVGKFDVDAICVHVGVLLEEAAQLLRRVSSVLAGDHRYHIDNRHAGRHVGSRADAHRVAAQQQCQLRWHIIFRSSRHGKSARVGGYVRSNASDLTPAWTLSGAASRRCS